MIRCYRSRLLVLSLATVVLQGGCVALSIPSERHHDPSDHGGILGHWRGHSQTVLNHQRGQAWVSETGSHELQWLDSEAATPDTSGPCLGHCGEDCFDCEPVPEPDPAEIPWPRFHPVPTRPVFGGTGTTGTIAE